LRRRRVRSRLRPQPTIPVSVGHMLCFRGPAVFSGLRAGRASLWQSISGMAAEETRISGAGLCSVFSDFRFGTAETGSVSTRDRFAEPHIGASIATSVRTGGSEVSYCGSPMRRSCMAHEYGSALARPVTVRSAGALPSTIAAMIRGETKASAASRRMCRSP
jgi:hypothetical protein